jgi:MOSC domain-containing protein YiiM
MWRGTVVSIHIAREAGGPMVGIDPARAVAGRGLEGDRYHDGTGFYSDHPGPIREVSLIEEETIEALRRDHNLALAPGVTRRNILTRGVPLNHLVGREFRVGGATMRGVELCEPCKHVVDVTGKKGLLATLIHRGGLHAQILSGGLIRAGDVIEEAGRTYDSTSPT